MKNIHAWAIVKGGKMDALEIYDTKDVCINKGEKIIRVTISPYVKKRSKLLQKKVR